VIKVSVLLGIDLRSLSIRCMRDTCRNRASCHRIHCADSSGCPDGRSPVRLAHVVDSITDAQCTVVLRYCAAKSQRQKKGKYGDLQMHLEIVWLHEGVETRLWSSGYLLSELKDVTMYR
jgi:hypothetical protein